MRKDFGRISLIKSQKVSQRERHHEDPHIRILWDLKKGLSYEGKKNHLSIS